MGALEYPKKNSRNGNKEELNLFDLNSKMLNEMEAF